MATDDLEGPFLNLNDIFPQETFFFFAFTVSEHHFCWKKCYSKDHFWSWMTVPPRSIILWITENFAGLEVLFLSQIDILLFNEFYFSLRSSFLALNGFIWTIEGHFR